MHASGAVVVSALVTVCMAFTLANGACTYSSTGQGGEAGAIEPYEASNPFYGSAGNDSGEGFSGSSGGGFSGSSGGSPPGSDASISPPGCATEGSCAGGICCGATCCPSDSTCCSDGNGCCASVTCPNGETACPNGVGCCETGGGDAAPPPMTCPPESPNFVQTCEAYYGGTNQGGACSACIAQQAESCGVKTPNCTVTSCEQMCDAELGCANGCATAAYCDCIYQCESPNGANDCCGPQTQSLYACAAGPCQSECAASADAGVR
jgi:hypothetical protein